MGLRRRGKLIFLLKCRLRKTLLAIIDAKCLSVWSLGERGAEKVRENTWTS